MSDKRPIPTFWDIAGEKAPQFQIPQRKWLAKDEANNPGITTLDFVGDLYQQANNIQLAQAQMLQQMFRGLRPIPGFMPRGGAPPPPGPPGPPYRGGGAGPLPARRGGGAGPLPPPPLHPDAPPPPEDPRPFGAEAPIPAATPANDRGLSRALRRPDGGGDVFWIDPGRPLGPNFDMGGPRDQRQTPLRGHGRPSDPAAARAAGRDATVHEVGLMTPATPVGLMAQEALRDQQRSPGLVLTILLCEI